MPRAPTPPTPCRPTRCVLPTDRPRSSAGEGTRTISDSIDAHGTETIVAEYAGIDLANPDAAPIGSVVIKTIIPMTPPTSSKSPCLTSTIVRTETVTGWAASVRKAGGCDKEIQAQFENKSLELRADFGAIK